MYNQLINRDNRELKANSHRAVKLRELAQLLLLQRRNLLATASAEEQRLAGEAQSLEEWGSRVEALRNRDRREGVKVEERIPVVPSFLSAYFPIDFEKEKTQILASYGLR